MQKQQGIGKTFMQIRSDPKAQKIPQSLRKLCQQASADCADMAMWRRPAAQMAEEAILGYMAMAQASKTGRSSFFPPTLHAIVYSRMALESATIPNVVYKHRRAKSEPQMKYINAAKKNAESGDYNMRPPALFNWYMQNFDKILFGVGFRYLSYLCQTRVINVKDEDTGKWKEKTCVVYDDIWDQKLSFFHTGVSRDTMPGMFGGTSAYTDMFFRREQFAARFLKNSMYMNIKLALATIHSEFIKVRLYWLLPQDLYLMMALPGDMEDIDDQAEGIPIRQDHILEYGPHDRPQKFIPITSIHGDFSFDMKTTSDLDMPLYSQAGRSYSEPLTVSRNPTFWTKGDGHLTKGVISLKRAIWRATADNVKASTVFYLMSQNPGVLSQIKRSDNYGIVPIKADERSFNVKALLERPQAFNGIREWDDAVDNLGVYALGHDWRQSAAQFTNEKATTAAIRENMKHVRSKLGQDINEAGGISRHYWCLLQLIQQFYPEKTKIYLASDEELPDDIEEPDILRDEDGSLTGEKKKPIGYKRLKKIPYDEMVNVTYDEKGDISGVKADEENGEMYIPGSKRLLVTAEEPEIYIEPGSTFASMKALERALDLERLDHYKPYLSLTYPDANGQMQPIIPKAGAEALLRKSAEVWDDDPDEVIPPENAKENERPPLHRPFAGARKVPPMPMSMAGAPAAPMMQGNSATGGMPPSGGAGNVNALAASLVPSA